MAEPDSTRDRLLDAAVALIVKRGWGGVSTRVVAEAAGVNAGVIHYHFDSVAALKREAVLRAFHREFGDRLSALAGLAPAEIVERSIQATSSFDVRGSLAMLIYEALPAAARDPELSEQLREPLQAFQRLLAASIETHHPNPQAPPKVLAELIAAAFDGLQLHLLVDPDLDLRTHLTPLLALLEPRAAR